MLAALTARVEMNAYSRDTSRLTDTNMADTYGIGLNDRLIKQVLFNKEKCTNYYYGEVCIFISHMTFLSTRE